MFYFSHLIHRQEGNMKSRIWLCSAIAIAVMLLQGCTLKPQYLLIDPAVQVKESSVGGGFEVGLSVADLRPDRKLGDVGDPNKEMVEVRLDKDPSPAIYLRVKDALMRQGFAVVPYVSGQTRTLHVEIRDLTLTSVKKPLVFDTELRAEVTAHAVNGGTRHDRQFNVRTRKEGAIPPYEKDSNVLVNDAISQALNDLVADEQILGVLAQ
jgi:uncharacterized lipoprotein YajG